ncbi:MAG: PadR family transcriptional regulator [Methanobacteriota archaeon]|nr:MAG: PadR family transcriptional regulator [Euryarchaeota archaeon]
MQAGVDAVEKAYATWEKKVKRGFLRLIILKRFRDKEEGNFPKLTGMDIINFIASYSHNRWIPSPGSVYPILREMQQLGMIEEVETDNKKEKVYQITSIGLKVFDRLRTNSPLFHGEMPDLSDPKSLENFKKRIRSYFSNKSSDDLKRYRNQFLTMIDVINDLLGQKETISFDH